ncbi:hypothetical protein LCGC14_0399630 [marine sediment metagenome]|uniref:Uncharacterized protein n=1 Tax=marine sediment metagenome TaxID=412755 RepID=A0A0F9VJ18_9ZZZZ
MKANTIIKRIRESKLSRKDLKEIANTIVYQMAALDAQSLYEYAPGDYVKWPSRKAGQLMFGIVRKLNRKSVGIDAKDGRLWRVAPSFLEKSSQEEYDKAPEFMVSLLRLPRPR